MPTCLMLYLYHVALVPNHVDFAIAILRGLKIGPAITMACCLGWDNGLFGTVITVPALVVWDRDGTHDQYKCETDRLAVLL